jgi:hypothetical protein
MNYRKNLMKRINQPLYNELLKNKNEGKSTSIYELTDEQIDILMFEEHPNSKELKELFDLKNYPDDIVEKAWQFHDWRKDQNDHMLIYYCTDLIKHYRSEKEKNNDIDLMSNIIKKEESKRLERMNELKNKGMYEDEDDRKRFIMIKLTYENFVNYLLNKLKEEKIENIEDFIINECESAMLSGEYSTEKYEMLFKEIEQQMRDLDEIKKRTNMLLFPTVNVEKKVNIVLGSSYDGIESNEEIQKIFDDSYNKLKNYQETDLDEIKKKLRMKVNKALKLSVEERLS